MLELYPFIVRKVILPFAAQFSKVKFWTEYKKMLQIEKLSIDELKSLQFSKLKAILCHAYAKIPFYKERFDEMGFDPNEFHEKGGTLPIPPTTKDDIMANFPENITAQGMDRTRWKYVASSGTTRQIMGIHDFRKANINWAAGLRSQKLAGNHDVAMKWMEIPPHMCTNICGIDDSDKKVNLLSKELVPLILKGDIDGLGQHIYNYFFSRRQNLYRRLTLPSFNSEGTNISEEDIDSYIGHIKKYQPHLLEGLPLYLHTFAKYLLRKGIPSPDVGVIKPFGGSMTTSMKETIKKAFNCDVYDTYGCSEMGFISCDCEKHEGNHYFMDLFYIEVCRDGRLVDPGELGRIYVTDLENRAMPWIRYDIGDVGRYFVEDHGCGRKAIRLQVEGRVEDTISNSKGELFTSDQLFDFFHTFSEIDNFQLLEKTKGNFDLLCVPSNGTSINKEAIANQFVRIIYPDAKVKIYIVKTIKAEDGGKFRFVKSKSFSELSKPPMEL